MIFLIFKEMKEESNGKKWDKSTINRKQKQQQRNLLIDNPRGKHILLDPKFYFRYFQRNENQNLEFQKKIRQINVIKRKQCFSRKTDCKILLFVEEKIFFVNVPYFQKNEEY